MQEKYRRRSRKIFIVFTCLVIIAYLLSCLVPYINPGTFWYIALLGMGFPFLFVLLFICAVICFFIRSRWGIISLVTLLVGLQQILVLFSFHTPKDFDINKPDQTLRILSWNIASLDEPNKNAKGGVSFRNVMLDFMQMQNADVICLQEFFESYDSTHFEANIPVIKNMGYPYYHFYPTSKIWHGALQFGLCIFSRFPIIDTADFVNGMRVHSEGLCYVDIKKQDHIFRVFTTHLESVGFGKQDYQELGSVETSRNILGKIRYSYQVRAEQAEMARKQLDASPYPSIICGDIDDVPNSYAYFKVKGNFQDAFLKKGSGLGRTFGHISPTLRIDYLFADKKFAVKQFTTLKVPYSDHYPILTDLDFVEKK